MTRVDPANSEGQGQEHPDDEPNESAKPNKRKGINVSGATLKERLNTAREHADRVATGTDFDELDI